MIVSAIINDLHYKWYLKIPSKLQVKSGRIFKYHEQCKSSILTEKIVNAGMLICTAVQIKS